MSFNQRFNNNWRSSSESIDYSLDDINRPSINTYFVSDGIYISTENLSDYDNTSDSWRLIISCEIFSGRQLKPSISFKDSNGALDNIYIKHEIVDKNNKLIGSKIDILHNPRNNNIIFSNVRMELHTPILWSLDNPYLYTIKSTLIQDGVVIDFKVQRFGFRTCTLSPDLGFYLNGIHLKLNGVCIHYNLGTLGNVFNKVALHRQFSLLKEMGVNSIRTSHNILNPEFLDLADEMGFLIIDELFNMDEKPKTEYDYSRFFETYSDKDIANWIRHDRNHPSVIIWCIGNELYNTPDDSSNKKVVQYLLEQIALHDYRKNSMIIVGANYINLENTKPCTDIVDIDANTINFKRYNFYFYTSCWTDYKSNPMIHISPYWNFNDGQVVDVKVVSNAPRVELFFNGKSLGIQLLDHRINNGFFNNSYNSRNFAINDYTHRIDESKKLKLTAEYKVKYQKGRLIAVAYDEVGNIIAEAKQTSFEESDSISFKTDKKSFFADGKDLIFVTIFTIDKAKNPVKNASNLIEINVSGEGKLVSLENGDDTDYNSCSSTSCKLFEGKLLAVISSTLNPGIVTVKISSNGLKTRVLTLESLPIQNTV